MKRFADVIIQFEESKNVSVLRNTEKCPDFFASLLEMIKMAISTLNTTTHTQGD
jgi:hypothetical protein